MNSFPRQEADRRTFFKQSLAAGLGAALFPVAAAERLDSTPGPGAVRLREKFFGCIAGVHLGSAMAAPVEGWSWEKIEREHGTLRQLLSYEHYRNGWKRPPGTTEDGVERQKLISTTATSRRTSRCPQRA